MTNEIKKSWLEKHWNHPKRLKRFMKKYSLKSRDIATSINLLKKYGIEHYLGERKNLLVDKMKFYQEQRCLLYTMKRLLERGEINEYNKTEKIEKIFNGGFNHYVHDWKFNITIYTSTN